MTDVSVFKEFVGRNQDTLAHTTIHRTHYNTILFVCLLFVFEWRFPWDFNNLNHRMLIPLSAKRSKESRVGLL